MTAIFSALLGCIVGIGGVPAVYIASVGTYRAIPSWFPGAHSWLRGVIALCVFLLSMTALGAMTNWLLNEFANASVVPRRMLGRDWALGFLVGLTSLALLARQRRK